MWSGCISGGRKDRELGVQPPLKCRLLVLHLLLGKTGSTLIYGYKFLNLSEFHGKHLQCPAAWSLLLQQNRDRTSQQDQVSSNDSNFLSTVFKFGQARAKQMQPLSLGNTAEKKS